MILLNSILLLTAVYLLLGFGFAIPFVTKGVDRIDEGAKGARWGFRLIIVPGTIVFWPFLLKKWIKISTVNKKNKSK